MFPPNRSFVIFILIIILLVACGRAPETAVVTPVAPPAVTRMPIQSTEDVFTVSLSEIAGGVLARTAQEPGFSEVKDGYIVQLLGQVQTQTDGKARLNFSTGSLVRLGPNTLFTLQPPEEDSQGLLIRIRLEVGRLWVVLQGGTLEVETKSGVAAVRGSYMSVSYDPDSGDASITCLEGNCSLSTLGGNVQITAGQTAVVTGAGEPPQVGDMNDQDVQDWLNNNPEATVVVSGLTETPVGEETPAATDEPPTGVAPLPPAVVNPPVPTEKTPPPRQPTDEPLPTMTLTAQPPALPTATSTTTQTATQTTTPTADPPPPALLVPLVEISSIGYEVLVVGEPVDVYITVLPASGGPLPTGTVNVFAAGFPICTAPIFEGTANCIGNLPMAGILNLVADYPGDSNYYGAVSTPEVLTVDKIITSTTITSYVPYPSPSENVINFTATVDIVPPGSGLPMGSVIFFASSGDECIVTSAPWSCDITFSSTCSQDVTATYSGDANFESSYDMVTLNVNPCY